MAEQQIDRVTQTLLHEYAHAFGDTYHLDEDPQWLALSGWERANGTTPAGKCRYVEERTGWPKEQAEWVHDREAWFARPYSAKSPAEDFADIGLFVLAGWGDRFKGGGEAKRDYLLRAMAGLREAQWITIAGTQVLLREADADAEGHWVTINGHAVFLKGPAEPKEKAPEGRTPAQGVSLIPTADKYGLRPEQIQIDSGFHVQQDMQQVLNGLQQPIRGEQQDVAGQEARTALPTVRRNAELQLQRYEGTLTAGSLRMTRDWIDTQTNLLMQANLTNVNAADVDSLMRDAVDKLVYQEYWSAYRSLNDHGVRHVLGDVENANEIFDAITRVGYNVSALERAAVGLAFINHDLGYTMPSQRETFDNQAHVPASAQMFAQTSYGTMARVFGGGIADTMMAGIATHDWTGIDWTTAPLISAMRVADNTSLFAAQKLPALFTQVPGAIEHLMTAAQALRNGDTGLFDRAKTDLMAAVDATHFEARLKDTLKHAANEINSYSPKAILGTLAGTVTGYDFHDHGKEYLTVNMQYTHEARVLQASFGMGQFQFAKFAKSYGVALADLTDPAKAAKVQFDRPDGRRVLELNITNPQDLMADTWLPSPYWGNADPTQFELRYRRHESEHYPDAPGAFREADRDLAEPTLPILNGRRLVARIVIRDGESIWLYDPKDEPIISLPGGGVEPNESPQAAAIREAQEETGLAVELVRFLGDFCDEYAVRRYYLAKRIGGKPTTRDEDGNRTVRVRSVETSVALEQLTSTFDRAAVLLTRGTQREANPYHEPAGSPAGGQFASGPEGEGAHVSMQGPSQRTAEELAAGVKNPSARALVCDAYAKALAAGDPTPPIESKALGRTIAMYSQGNHKMWISSKVNSKTLEKYGDEQVKAGWWTQPNPVLHELGHAAHATVAGEMYDVAKNHAFSASQKATIEQQVSRYAAKNGIEFVAEVYAGVRAGRTYGEEVMGMFKAVTLGRLDLAHRQREAAKPDDAEGDWVTINGHHVFIQQRPGERTPAPGRSHLLSPKAVKADAVRLGKLANQKAIFDLETFTEINTGGDGKVAGAPPMAQRQALVRRIRAYKGDA